jgi:hypothetical protein
MLAFIVHHFAILFGVTGRGLQLCHHATGLDTNCCGGGALTAIVLQPGQNRRLWTVDSVLKGVPLLVRQIDATPCSNSNGDATTGIAANSAAEGVAVELDTQQHHHKHHKGGNGCCLS